MRYTPAIPQVPIQEMLDPRRVLRWVWLGRVVLSCAILVAAVFVWSEAAPSDTLIATLAFAGATLATIGSALYGEFERRALSLRFYGLQCAIDLALVTAVVHITGGWSSQFAALYILVIASAALLLPFRGGLAVAGGACLLYAADVLLLRPGTPYVGITVQIAVFVVVALGSGYVSSRLRQAGVGREALAAQLVKVQLEAADILRTIRSGIMTVDAQGRLLYANPAASDLLGLDLRSLVGRPVLNTLLGVSPQLATLLEQSSRDGVRTTRAEGVIHRDGETVEIGVTTTIANGTRSDGGVTATAIFQDISDSKRIQALHIRAERLQAVAELSASLAHEIRNPLASIRSATEQLARRRARSLEPTVDDDDERILHDLVVREADRLSRLLADFLDFARARVTRVSRVDLGAIAHAASTIAGSHPDRRAGVQVQVSVAPELPPVEGDEDLLHRAVFNLVLNAVQAVGPEGHVFIEVDRYRPAGEHGAASAMLTGELLTVSVTDDGPGVPPELKERLFEPFVTGKAGGTGLGLPVVHRAVEAHRGVVLVDSLARGTRFTMLLPIASDNDSSRRGETPVHNAVPFEPHQDDAADVLLPRLTGVAP
ncbi:two-component system sensor histidine kinase NtrB [Gemmatimonas groenlandica]|uniref:histidine kinase n=1 Tax=Gemmatimonas groenlandica TaxID=2732249 RepID=A0A6M4IPY3_9BACT|nr:ATP-binding protein [Gemmatimonas groenlandica]QJR34341.1 PAS domain S-box protein [Gemmatimonas groenlandica]